jgi:hypothetical protein
VYPSCASYRTVVYGLSLAVMTSTMIEMSIDILIYIAYILTVVKLTLSRMKRLHWES